MRTDVLVNIDNPQDRRVIHIEDDFIPVQIEGTNDTTSLLACLLTDFTGRSDDYLVPVYRIIKKTSENNNDEIPIGDYFIYINNNPEKPYWDKIKKKLLKTADRKLKFK